MNIYLNKREKEQAEKGNYFLALYIRFDSIHRSALRNYYIAQRKVLELIIH